MSSRDLGFNGARPARDALDGATHHSSSDLRIGTIYGGLEPSIKLFLKHAFSRGIAGEVEMISRELARSGGSTGAGSGPRWGDAHSSSVLRTGTIYGGPDTFREISFAACP